MAGNLARAPSTIAREVRRNRCTDAGYRAFKADSLTRTQRSRSPRNERFTPGDWATVERYLCLDWSPEQVAGFLRAEGLMRISHETIYLRDWRDKKAGGEPWRHLRQAAKKRRKRYGAYDSRGRLAGNRHISERPVEVEARAQIGLCEIDTVKGNDQARYTVVTIVERKTGYLAIGKLMRHTAAETAARCIELIARDAPAFTTITADNGSEFHKYRDIEAATGAVFCFATPHHSWERGTNENTNGLIRQYLPKRTSMAHISQADSSDRRQAQLTAEETPGLQNAGGMLCRSQVDGR